MRSHRPRAVLVVVSLLLAGCATYQPPPLTAAHPAHPDAPAGRPAPASHTLADVRTDAGTVVAAPPASPGKTVVGEGEVVATTPASGQLVVDHGAIKGFMDAMTMGYRIDPPSLLTTVKPGDRIKFTIDVDRRAIVHIEKLP
jgi:Cu/Ag efflux protein CusF